MAEHSSFPVQVLTPEGGVFEGEVVELSTRTVRGEVGVLANHAPMMARLVPAELRLHVSGEETIRYAQGEGWLEVFGNRVVVLVGEAVPPEQLDAAALRDRIADAELRLGEAEEGSATYDLAERDKARAEAFLKLCDQ